MDTTFLISEIVFDTTSVPDSRVLRPDCRFIHEFLIGSYFPSYLDALKFVSYYLQFFHPGSKSSFRLHSVNLDKIGDINDFYLLKLVINVS